MGDVTVMGNFGVRYCDSPMRAGDAVEGHAHNFDHVTYVPCGTIRFDLLAEDGSVERSVVKSSRERFNFVLIKAGRLHRLTALEDGTRYDCLYLHRGMDGEVIDAYDGWEASYV